MNRLSATNTLALLVLAMLMMAGVPAAALECGEDLTNMVVAEDILVKGDCVLRGTTVKGSVRIDGGSLKAKRGTLIVGDVTAVHAGDLMLADTNVIGNITLQDSSNLRMVGSNAQTVMLERSGDLIVRGGYVGEVRLVSSGGVAVFGEPEFPVGLESVDASASGSIALRHVRVFPGGVTSTRADGGIELCGAEIGVDHLVPGIERTGVTLMESRGDLRANGPECGASRIMGAVTVRGGAGDVRLDGATLMEGNLVVVEQSGDVSVNDTRLHGMQLARNTGSTALQNVAAAHDTAIIENDGDVRITGSELSEDVVIRSNRAVTVIGNNFTPEDVSILHNDGPTVVEDNSELSLTAVDQNRRQAAERI